MANDMDRLEIRFLIWNLSGSFADGNFVPWSEAAGCQDISSPPKLIFAMVIGSCIVMG